MKNKSYKYKTSFIVFYNKDTNEIIKESWYVHKRIIPFLPFFKKLNLEFVSWEEIMKWAEAKNIDKSEIKYVYYGKSKQI